MSEVLVLGAGIVGVSSALALQARGFDVTLVDRDARGRQASFGNAGIIQAEAVEPYAFPRDLRRLLAIATGRSNDVAWRLRALPEHLGPLVRYWRASATTRHRRAAQVYARLIAAARGAHAPLIAAADAEALIRREGFRQIYRTRAGFDIACTEAARLGRDYGVNWRNVPGPELHAEEPALPAHLGGAVHWTDPWTCTDPGALVRAYAALLRARGGRILRGDAMTLARRGAGWQVWLEEGPVSAGAALVTLGADSPPLAARFGLRVPMVRKRGHHRHFTGGAALGIATLDAATGSVWAPMRSGLRLTTGADLARPGDPPDRRQLVRAEAGIRALFDPGQPEDAEPWWGERPCMPDMLPVVGPLPGQPGLWANFGHGHQGFTLGPATAAILARQMAEGIAGFPELSPARL